VNPEPFVKKYGKRHRELIEKMVPILVASRPELDAYGVDAVLAAAVPKLKLPLMRMSNGTLVPATGITVRVSAPFAGVAVALIIEGEEIPLEEETYLNSFDSLHVDLSTPGTLVLPPAPAAVPTKAELLRELADATELLEGLDGVLDRRMFEGAMSYQYPPEMTPWRTPQGPASNGRIRAIARQWTRWGDISEAQIHALPSTDRLRLQEAVRALEGEC
jgi:hypothetical protein